MGDFDSNNSNLANTVGGLKSYNGRVLTELKNWRKRNFSVLRINRRDAYAIINGQSRPTTATEGSTAFVYHPPGF